MDVDFNLKPSLFFKSIPNKIAKLFPQEKEVWFLLKGGLKEFFTQELYEKNTILGEVSPQAFLEGVGIFIDERAKVEPSAYIKGPCYIGKKSEIRHGAYLRGNVYVGEHCVVGHCTEVKHSVFLDHAKAGHFNYIGDSVLGSCVNLGAGTKLANLKMVPGNITLKIKGESSIDSGLRKFGSILGDGTETGCNSVMNPGTLLAPNSAVFPNVSARGVYTKASRIIR